MLRARAASICAWRGDWLWPAARKRRGGESGEVEPDFGPASTPSTTIYRGRWGTDVGACNRDAGSGLCEKSPSTHKSGRAARYGTCDVMSKKSGAAG
jgi:hypothetical protein